MIDVYGLYQRLFDAYGPQYWWPSEDRFETMVGAMLVQRTSWSNAERALSNLKQASLLNCERLAQAQLESLGEAVRPAGFFRVKSQRLRAMAKAVNSEGGLDVLACRETRELRRFLLSVCGIGQETADVILLYAFGRPAVVIDEYYRRVWRRLWPSGTDCSDTEIRVRTAAAIKFVPDLNELHALIVEHAKVRCRSHAECSDCCLRADCYTGSVGTSNSARAVPK